MHLRDEGYIKYRCEWEESEIVIPNKVYRVINKARQDLRDRNLIGMYEDGIGFGNISMRNSDDPFTFFISATATGDIISTRPEHYCLVKNWDLDENHLVCQGPMRASSESMSHAVIYEQLPEVQSVVHVHNDILWNHAIQNLPGTPMSVSYGTPEMAWAIQNLIEKHEHPENLIFGMAGHEDGVISYGNTVMEAVDNLLFLFEKLKKKL